MFKFYKLPELYYGFYKSKLMMGEYDYVSDNFKKFSKGGHHMSKEEIVQLS